MEDQNITQKRTKGTWGGLILILIGVFLFLQNLHLDIPHWIFSWKMLLVALGLLVGAEPAPGYSPLDLFLENAAGGLGFAGRAEA